MPRVSRVSVSLREAGDFYPPPDVRMIVVSLDPIPRLFKEVEVWPAKRFLEQLWAGKIFQ